MLELCRNYSYNGDGGDKHHRSSVAQTIVALRQENG